MLLFTFGEPVSGMDRNFYNKKFQIYLEGFFLLLYWLDIILEIIHLKYDKDHRMIEKITISSWWIYKLVFLLLFSIDFIYFYVNFPCYRIGRVMRPSINNINSTYVLL